MLPFNERWFSLRGMAIDVCHQAGREDLVVPDEIEDLVDELMSKGLLSQHERNDFLGMVESVHNELS